MLNLRRIKADSSGSPCTRSASATTPLTSDACDLKNAARLSASAVSSTVPSASTTRMSRKVWYVFCDTPQHMPDELLATTPPTMQLSTELGSGPILYWTGNLPLRWWLARRRLTSPKMRPGSTVMEEPSPYGCFLGCFFVAGRRVLSERGRVFCFLPLSPADPKPPSLSQTKLTWIS
jgi:hypothetical protein